MRELVIGKNDAGQRLDKFITKTLDLPPSLLYKSIRLKKIKVNRKRAENNQVLLEGDTIQCFLAEEFFEKRADEHSFASITPHLDVIYEDENIMLLNKRPGVSVHEDEDGSTNTLITHIQAYLYQKGEYEEAIENYKIALEQKSPHEDEECYIRINLALAIIATLNEDYDSAENIQQSIDTLTEARQHLVEEDCATEEGDGHNETAEKLKQQ